MLSRYAVVIAVKMRGPLHPPVLPGTLAERICRIQPMPSQAVTDADPIANPQNYIDTRLKGQLDWYRTKAAKAKRRFTVLASVQFGMTAAVPVLNAIGAHDPRFIYLASFCAAVAAVSMGFLALGSHQQNWLRYRQAASSLETIFWLFTNGAAPFNGPDRARLLVERAEDVMAQESGQWRSELTKGNALAPLRPV